MPQETNTLNFWKKHAGKVIATASPQNIGHLLNSKIPAIDFQMDRSPHKLINALAKLI